MALIPETLIYPRMVTVFLNREIKETSFKTAVYTGKVYNSLLWHTGHMQSIFVYLPPIV